MLEQINILAEAIDTLAMSKNKSTKKYLSLVGEHITLGDLTYDLILKLDELGYKITKK